MRSDFKKILLICSAAILTAVLYFAPQKTEKQEEVVEQSGPSFEGMLKEAKGQLKRQELDQITAVEKELEKQPSSMELKDSLGRLWDRVHLPQISAMYFEQIAEINPGEKSWINAAYRYYDAFNMTSDSSFRTFFVEKAMNAYRKVIELNPDNLDAKTDLGLCYAEGTSNPMQGIMLLREVTEKNPRHEMAQYNLGILSLKSGQYEKAAERFEKVLQINPAAREARFLLGRTYASMGKKDLALSNLNQLKNSGDPGIDKEVTTLINQINNN